MSTVINVLCLTACMSFATAFGQSSTQSSTLAGRYTLDAQASDSIVAALETVFADLDAGPPEVAVAFFKTRHPAYPQIKISHDAGEVVVTLDNGNPMHMPMDGTAAPWTREDGKILQIKGAWTPTKLIQSVDTRDTLRINEFSLSPDGQTLTLKVDFTGYPKPLNYRLIYRRQNNASGN